MKTNSPRTFVRSVLLLLLLTFSLTANGSSTSITRSNAYYPNVLTYAFTNTGHPTGPGTLTVVALADLDYITEFLTLGAEFVLTNDLFVADGQQLILVTNVVNLTQSQLAALAADGVITFTLTPSFEVNPTFADIGRFGLFF
jgi:hypothetical protein